MSANTTPIFGLTPHSSWIQTSASAVTSTDGTDANVKTAFTAGINGSRVDEVYITLSATNVATVVRFWINNGSAPATATNNSMIHEETFAPNTLSQVAANGFVLWRPNLVLPAGYKLQVAAGTATAALNITVNGSDF